MTKNENRLLSLSNVFASYSLGDFKAKAPLSKDLDELDSIISGVNMLGEELSETTVSRDFLAGVLNSMSESLFVIDSTGRIASMNEAATQTFGYGVELVGKSIVSVLKEKEISDMLNEILATGTAISEKFELKCDGKDLFFSCYISSVHARSGELANHLLVMRDISAEKEMETKVLKAVMQTQENERQRLASDLHDGFGSEMGLIKPVLSTIKNEVPLDLNIAHEGLDMCIEMAEGIMMNIRNTCFDVAPNTLTKNGLTKTLERLCNNVNLGGEIDVVFEAEEVTLTLEKGLSLYRITQEFIQNSIKHSHAKKIVIRLKNEQNAKVFYSIEDDGIGFDIETMSKSDGRGIDNMKTRVQVFGGFFEFRSEPNKGTIMQVMF